MRWTILAVVCLFVAAGAEAEEMGELPLSPQLVQPILIGSQAPVGVLPDATGADFDLGAAIDGRPTILVFYRAHW